MNFKRELETILWELDYAGDCLNPNIIKEYVKSIPASYSRAFERLEAHKKRVKQHYRDKYIQQARQQQAIVNQISINNQILKLRNIPRYLNLNKENK